MKHIVTDLSVGAEKPFTVLHVCDIHLTRTDARDSDALRELSEKRKLVYPDSEAMIDEITALSQSSGYPVLATGDLMDFNSPANRERVTRFVSETDSILIPGNHDYRPFGGMGYDVPESRNASLPQVQEAFGNTLYMSAHVRNGVNIVSLDNVYYRFDAGQLTALKKEVEKGLPILLLLHVPLYHPICFDAVVNEKRAYASLVAVPEEKMQDYPPKRYTQQIADEITRETVDYICRTTAIKAILCGHVHKDVEAVLCDRLPQYVTSIGTIRECRIQ